MADTTTTTATIPYCSPAAIAKRLSSIPGAPNTFGCVEYTPIITTVNDPTLTQSQRFAIAVRSKRARQNNYCG